MRSGSWHHVAPRSRTSRTHLPTPANSVRYVSTLDPDLSLRVPKSENAGSEQQFAPPRSKVRTGGGYARADGDEINR